MIGRALRPLSRPGWRLRISMPTAASAGALPRCGMLERRERRYGRSSRGPLRLLSVSRGRLPNASRTPNPSSAGLALQLDGFAVRRTLIGFGPGFFAFQERGRVTQTLLYHQALQRCQPTVVVGGTISRSTTQLVGLQLLR